MKKNIKNKTREDTRKPKVAGKEPVDRGDLVEGYVDGTLVIGEYVDYTDGTYLVSTASGIIHIKA